MLILDGVAGCCVWLLGKETKSKCFFGHSLFVCWLGFEVHVFIFRVAGSNTIRMKRSFGGYKQRQAQAEAAKPGSALAQTLLTEWLWGRVPIDVVQKFGQAALQDLNVSGVHPGGQGSKIMSDLQGLASLGATGSKPGNFYRDLTSKLTASHWPEPYKVLAPMVHGEGHLWRPFGLLLPHEVFAQIFQHYRSTWERSICPGEPQADEFWRAQQHNPQFRNHPLFRDGLPKKAIPITLHGDGIPTTAVGKTWAKSTDVVSWTSLLAVRGLKTMESNWLVWLMYSSLYVKTFWLSSTRVIWTVVAWSFKCLQEGRWPEVDHKGDPFAAGTLAAEKAGQPLADGWRGILVCMKGDLDWFQKMMNLLSVQSTNPCCFCPCDTLDDSMPWSDFRAEALWRAREFDATTEIPHVMFQDVPGLNLFAVKVDYMHTKHLGTDSYLAGGVLLLLCYYIMPGTPAANLQHILEEAKRLEQHPNMFGSLSLGMFLEKKESPHLHYPKLKGKAAEVKAFLRPLCQIWQANRNPTMQVHLQIELALQSSLSLDEIADAHSTSHTLVGDDLQRFRTALNTLLVCFSAAVAHYEGAGLKVFNLTVKAHYLAHLHNQVPWLHPRHSWCYSGEDFVQHLKWLTKVCTPGLNPKAVPLKALARYSLAMHAAMSPGKVLKK